MERLFWSLCYWYPSSMEQLPYHFQNVLVGISLGLGLTEGEMTLQHRIVFDLRLTRTLFAAIIGAGLGIVGVILQTTTRNDLADPFLFGLSSGAAAGAVFVITITGDILGFWTLPLAAFCGGLVASGIVLALVHGLRTSAPEKLILSGLAVSFLFSAITNYLIFYGDNRAAHSAIFLDAGWFGTGTMGDLPTGLYGITPDSNLFIISKSLVGHSPDRGPNCHHIGCTGSQVEILVVFSLRPGNCSVCLSCRCDRLCGAYGPAYFPWYCWPTTQGSVTNGCYSRCALVDGFRYHKQIPARSSGVADWNSHNIHWFCFRISYYSYDRVMLKGERILTTLFGESKTSH